MEECSYCGASFEDEAAYLDHLAAAHEDDLGTIDRRRVAARGNGDGDGDGVAGFPTGPAVLLAVLVAAAGVVAYVIFFAGGAGSGSATVNGFEVARTPGAVGTVHEHGLMTVTVDDREIDFSRPRYQYARTGADAFHFEGGNGRVWHKHAPDVTLEYAMATLGIGVSERSVTIDGTTYRDGDPGTNVTVRVNGEPVTPSEYVLRGASDANPEAGDRVRIAVSTG